VDFHRDWVERGLLRPWDLNVNILQSPDRFRIDAFPKEMKEELIELYTKHIEWLEPNDPLQRATNGFKSAIEFMMAHDNTKQLKEFIFRTKELDRWRNENTFADFPELERLYKYE
jgi:hypothetical protein